MGFIVSMREEDFTSINGTHDQWWKGLGCLSWLTLRTSLKSGRMMWYCFFSSIVNASGGHRENNDKDGELMVFSCINKRRY